MNDALPRFMTKINVIPGGCWEWTGSKNNTGYGNFQFNKKVAKAHRAAYEMFVGPIPEGLVLDHLCSNPGCVNPAHLQPVTNLLNIRRAYGGIIVHPSPDACLRGHLLSEENTRVNKTGTRSCRTCDRERMAKARENPEVKAKELARDRAYKLKKRGPEPKKLGRPKGVNLVTHCHKGHPYDEINTYLENGFRRCRACRLEKAKKAYQKDKQKVFAYQRAWHEKNKEKANARRRELYAMKKALS